MVLVAQSQVGREGLNLHEEYRTVVLLYAEWNPGILEQQIGRVDRKNRRWFKDLHDW
jgi:SNF2 family DNA or RNA helicase